MLYVPVILSFSTAKSLSFRPFHLAGKKKLQRTELHSTSTTTHKCSFKGFWAQHGHLEIRKISQASSQCQDRIRLKFRTNSSTSQSTHQSDHFRYSNVYDCVWRWATFRISIEFPIHLVSHDMIFIWVSNWGSQFKSRTCIPDSMVNTCSASDFEKLTWQWSLDY